MLLRRRISALRETKINSKLEFLTYQINQFSLERDETVSRIDRASSTDDIERFQALDEELKKNIAEAKELTRIKK